MTDTHLGMRKHAEQCPRNVEKCSIHDIKYFNAIIANVLTTVQFRKCINFRAQEMKQS